MKKEDKTHAVPKNKEWIVCLNRPIFPDKFVDPASISRAEINLNRRQPHVPHCSAHQSFNLSLATISHAARRVYAHTSPFTGDK